MQDNRFLEKRSLPFDGQLVNLREIREYDVAELKHLYECQHVDVTWLCTECHRRPYEFNLEEARARIEAFDTGRVQRAMHLWHRAGA